MTEDLENVIQDIEPVADAEWKRLKNQRSRLRVMW